MAASGAGGGEGGKFAGGGDGGDGGGGGGGDTLTVPYNHFLSLQKFLDKTYLL